MKNSDGMPQTSWEQEALVETAEEELASSEAPGEGGEGGRCFADEMTEYRVHLLTLKTPEAYYDIWLEI